MQIFCNNAKVFTVAFDQFSANFCFNKKNYESVWK